jgi:hypothetical protein
LLDTFSKLLSFIDDRISAKKKYNGRQTKAVLVILRNLPNRAQAPIVPKFIQEIQFLSA